MSNFFLRKWYLDAADDEGNVYIGYWASVQWRTLCLHFHQQLFRTAEQGVQVHSEFSKQPEPIWIANERLVWRTDDVNAVWHSTLDGLDKTLLRTKQGEIRWHCPQPKASADIRLPNLSFKGYGYTECIEITIPVWKLPFDTLDWGRSHTTTDYIVWIQWGGATQQSLVWHNGKCSTDLTITDNQICGADFQLNLGDNITLREGQIGSTVLQSFDSITKHFPEEVLGIYEHKWYNRGECVTKNSTEKAITIYETAHW
jgi:hypothetical protein